MKCLLAVRATRVNFVLVQQEFWSHGRGPISITEPYALSADDEDGGWMLSAYCGTDVLTKEHFYTANNKKQTKSNTCKDLDMQKYTSNENVYFAASAVEIDGRKTVMDAKYETPVYTKSHEHLSAVQGSAGDIKDTAVHTNRKRTASYAFVSSEPTASYGLVSSAPTASYSLVSSEPTASYALVSSEPESNNNKTQYDDAYVGPSDTKASKMSSAEVKGAGAKEFDTPEDRDYIFENPYLVEYRYDNTNTQESNVRKGKNYGHQSFENRAVMPILYYFCTNTYKIFLL